MSLFEVHDLSVSYTRQQVLFNVTLPTLKHGEVLGLLGPNAAGKSTLMQAMSGTQKYSGKILLEQKSYQQIGHKDWHKQIAYMPQTPPQASSLLPYELLWSAARAISLDLSDTALESEIEHLFNTLGLSDFATSPLYSLSGGKRQLVGLALAMIRNPKLMLLDEPTSALDLHWRMVVLDYIRERVVKKGVGAIAALHDLDLAARYCDKIVLLDSGYIVAAGTPQEVLTKENIASVYKVDVDITNTDAGYLQISINHPIRA